MSPIRPICVITVRRRQKISDAGSTQLKNPKVLGAFLGSSELSSLNVLRVLTTKRLCRIFHGLFRNNGATREATIE